MDIMNAYNEWSESYDEVDNKTRDLDARVLRKTLENLPFKHVLELGCGTGKNTLWLKDHAESITAVDFSGSMLAKAKEKLDAPNVRFIEADLNKDWDFLQNKFDLVCFDLVLEHIQNLDAVFMKAADALKETGWMFFSELHPYKQYSGSKARFLKEGMTQVLTCYTHHISDYIKSAQKNSFIFEAIDEWFDDDQQDTPRLISMLFKKG